MSKTKYATTRQKAARARVAAMLPGSCYRCRGIVTAEMRWEADHPISRAEGEARGMSAYELDAMVVPAHASCNHKAGAVLGNKLKAQKKRKAKQISRIERPKPKFILEQLETPAAAPQNLSPDGAQDAL